MSLYGVLCCCMLLTLFVSHNVNGWQQKDVYSRQPFSYPRDWDTHRYYQSDTTPDIRLWPRMEVLSGPQGPVAPVLRSGPRVRSVSNNSTKKFYRGEITSQVSDGPKVKRRGRRRHLKRNKGDPIRKRPGWKLNPDHPRRSKVCARCPSDRVVLAKKGSTSALMQSPPIIPCTPWSSVKKVKQKVLAGPQPGDEVPEGSHKIVIRLFRHRRTLVNCVARYNVIVRKCGELEVGPGVKVNCPLGKAWGARCNISCEPGYQLEGDSVTECTDDLEWSGTTPHCVPTTACPVPITPDHGQLSCRTPRHQPVQPRGMLPDGSKCHYLCDPGYTIPPAEHHLSMIRCVAGSWDSSQDPTCVESNDLEEEEEPEISAEEALSFNAEDCPKGYCLNGGLCIMILGEPLCSCRTGYYGSTCEHGHLTPDTDLTNTIT